MQAIILVGGFGTRLQSIVNDVPKPMASVNDRPFLEYILDDLTKWDFSKFVLAVGYKKEVIQHYFGNNYKGIPIEYSVEEEPLGTGGAIIQAMDLITDENFFVINGDTLFVIKPTEMIMKEPIVIASKFLKENSRYGHLNIINGYIHDFREKGEVGSGYINGGIYYLNKSYLKKQFFPKKFSIEKDLFEKIVKVQPIRTVSFDGYFIDIGIPEDYIKFIEDSK